MKKCIMCHIDITNGLNGCMMYDTCFTCKPIVYYQKPIVVKSTCSESELNYIESKCINTDE